MADTIRIQMMDGFLIYVNDQRMENPVSKSRKGVALVEYLILHRGQSVPNQRLMRALWQDPGLANPENALKTLISRMRTLLNQISEGLGSCLVSDRGSYHWENLEGMQIDALEIMDIFDRLKATEDQQEKLGLYQRLMKLYRGDLYMTGCLEDEAAYAERLHGQYLAAVYDYIELLRRGEEFNEISTVCRAALDVDSFDDRLHIELMQALVNLDRPTDAMQQYSHATSMTYRYLGAAPSEEMKAFYRQMHKSRRTLKFNLDVIRNDLRQSEQENGAFECDYVMFREIYNLQMRNIERLGSSMFLGIIMLGDASEESEVDEIRQDLVMADLMNIIRKHLRKGDIFTRYAPSIVALLLPTVNYETGTIVMERVRQLFYKIYPSSDIPLHYRLGVLGRKAEAEESELP